MLKRLVFFLIIWYNAPGAASAFRPLPLLRHYTLRDGLPSNVIYDVYQDSKGFVWFCTDQGISRFDGSEFRNYSVMDGLPDTEIFRIREDGQKRYWLICYNNKACYLLNGKVYNSTNDPLCRRVEQMGIRYDEMFTDRNGNDCLAGNKIGILTVSPPYIQLLPGFETEDARIGHFRKDGEDYIAAKKQVYNLTSGRIALVTDEGIVESCFSGSSLFLLLCNARKWSIHQWRLEKGHFQLVRKMDVSPLIHQMTRDGRSRLLCCSEKGVLAYNMDDGKWEKDEAFPPGIRCNRILDDREGNRWLITLNNGVYFSAKNGGAVMNTRSGLGGNNIQSLYFSSGGELIAGDDAGRINLIGKNGIRTAVVNNGSGQKRVLFARDLDAHTLIIGGDIGLYATDRRSLVSRLLCFYTFKTGLLCDTQFLAGHAGGLLVYQVTTGKMTNVAGSRVPVMAMDRRGVLWLAINKGLAYYKDGHIVAYEHHPLLSQSRVTCMSLTAAGNLLAGTSTNGLFAIESPTRPPRHLQVSGVTGNNCKRLFASKDSSVWLSSETGLYRLTDQRAGSFQASAFPLPDMITAGMINDLQEREGKLYLATSAGIVILDSRDTAIAKPPSLYIDAVNGRSLSTNQRDTVLPFPYKERNIQVSYTGISFSGGSKLQYKYLLRGGSEDTLYTSVRSIDFSALSPGAYELLLWARSPYSLWTSRPVRLAFVILPPFWRHPLFLVVSGFLLVILSVIFYRIRMNAVQRKAERIARSRQQMAELEMKALRAQINPHFIFNALNSIQSYYSQNDELKANHYMTSFARFVRLTLMHSQSHWLPLGEEITMLRTYIELEQMRFKGMFSFTITCGPGVAPGTITIPAMLIQPYVENAINHGLRCLEGRKGLLNLRFGLQQDALLCEVEDNGVGRGYDAGNKPGHKSLGMKINQERIDAMNRMYEIDIRMMVIDKLNGQGIAEGTLIQLFIPLKKQITYADHYTRRR